MGRSAMILTIELDPRLEEDLHQEAARQGVEPHRLVLTALEDRLRAAAPPASRLSARETELLQQISLGPPADWWQQYEALKARRQAETLTAEEQGCLIEMSNHLERLNVQRMQHLVELARLRATPLEALMRDLDLSLPVRA